MCVRPLILVECKKQEVSEAEFQRAITQAYSYAFALPGKVTSLKSRTLTSVTAIKQTEAYKTWNTGLLADYARKVDELKSKLTDEYQQSKQKELPDYPIFMAIAEEIGYDATGKKTAVNELDVIERELKKFIDSLS